jgi:Cu(I)/Ag(I) efflux system membrane fusion protein
MRIGDRVEILSGLEPGQRIVTSGTFLVASESRLRAALEQW